MIGIIFFTHQAITGARHFFQRAAIISITSPIISITLSIIGLTYSSYNFFTSFPTVSKTGLILSLYPSRTALIIVDIPSLTLVMNGLICDSYSPTIPSIASLTNCANVPRIVLMKSRVPLIAVFNGSKFDSIGPVIALAKSVAIEKTRVNVPPITSVMI